MQKLTEISCSLLTLQLFNKGLYYWTSPGNVSGRRCEDVRGRGDQRSSGDGAGSRGRNAGS